MAKYRKKPVVIEATQWFENGDHPKDGPREKEGMVVRYFKRSDVDGQSHCKECGDKMHCHGWIDTHESGHIVCPADWIITDCAGEQYPCKPQIFDLTYDPI